VKMEVGNHQRGGISLSGRRIYPGDRSIKDIGPKGRGQRWKQWGGEREYRLLGVSVLQLLGVGIQLQLERLGKC